MCAPRTLKTTSSDLAPKRATCVDQNEMDETEIKHIVEAALLAAGRPLTLDRLLELFTKKGGGPDRAAIRRALDALAADYQARGIEIKEVASGFRVQVKRWRSDWPAPLWEERAPRYTRALLETLALVAYRQPITRAEIEEVRGVVVSTNIVRTLLERGWIRVVGHRDVPGKPAMFGTTREFLDYFGLKRLEDLPPLAEIKDNFPELSPQADLIESLDTGPHLTIVGDEDTEAAVEHEPGEPANAADEGSNEGTSELADTAESSASEVDETAPLAVMSEELASEAVNDGPAADIADEDTVANAADDDADDVTANLMGVETADDAVGEGTALADVVHNDAVCAETAVEPTVSVEPAAEPIVSAEAAIEQAVAEDRPVEQAVSAETQTDTETTVETPFDAGNEVSVEAAASAEMPRDDVTSNEPHVAAPTSAEMPVHMAAAVESA